MRIPEAAIEAAVDAAEAALQEEYGGYQYPAAKRAARAALEAAMPAVREALAADILKWELEEADIETFDCTMVKPTENNPYDQKWVPSGTVADLYTTEYILWRINQALQNARKPWLDAQPGETWLIFAYNEYRGRRMWMLANVTSHRTFIVRPPHPNDAYTMYYQLDSLSIHTARKLED